MSDETHQSGKLPAISEVAIVVGIIGVMGIAMAPAFVKTRQDPREKAQQVACLSNLKQLDLGLLQYVQDYDESYPACYKGAPQGWAGREWPYVKAAAVFTCPVDPTTPDAAVTPRPTVISYAMNSNMVDKSPEPKQKPGGGLKIKDVNSPASSIGLFEIAGADVQLGLSDEGSKGYTKSPPTGSMSPSGDGIGDGPEWGWQGKGSSPLKYQINRHFGGGNYAFIDGHCKFLMPIAVSSGRDNPSPTGAQDDPQGSAAGSGAGYPTFSIN